LGLLAEEFFFLLIDIFSVVTTDLSINYSVLISGDDVPFSAEKNLLKVSRFFFLKGIDNVLIVITQLIL